MKVVLLSKDAKPPIKATEGAGGFDLFSREDVVVPGSITIGKRVAIGHKLVATGIAIEIPRGFVGRLGSRSGLSVKYNIEVGAGWIDSDYRGEILVELKNLGSEDFLVSKGDRIAQLFILPALNESVEIVKILPHSERGDSGFGSTGV